MRTIFIAEAGVNHNGNINYAKKLIDLASRAKADYVKFQSYKVDNLIRKETKTANYQKKNIKKKITQYDLLKKYELNFNDHKKLIKYAKIKKIKFLSSVFDIESFEMLIKLKIFDIKIPSGEINNIPLIKNISKKAKRVFISTGMASIKEISNAVKILKKNKKLKNNIYLMHCHTGYPTELKDVNLLFMLSLKKKFKTNVGYSDHTKCNRVGIAAVALGAKVIEKHFTISKKLKGPDHSMSMEPNEIINFVKDIKSTQKLLGSYEKKITKVEISNKYYVRKSIVAKRFIQKGEKFSDSNLTCKRPEGGISPIYWNKIIGKKAKKNFLTNQNIYL